MGLRQNISSSSTGGPETLFAATSTSNELSPVNAGHGSLGFCTHPQRVDTYWHESFLMCPKHARWIYPPSTGTQQRQIRNPAAVIGLHRTFCRLQRRTNLPQNLHQRVWELLRENALLLANSTWHTRLRGTEMAQHFVQGLDDRIEMFPETLRVFHACVNLAERIESQRSNGSPDQIRAHLRRKLEFAGGDNWILVEGLTAEMRQHLNTHRY